MLCMPNQMSQRPQCLSRNHTNQTASVATKEENIEAEDLTETIVKFVQIKEITAINPLTVSTANELIVTNAVISK